MDKVAVENRRSRKYSDTGGKCDGNISTGNAMEIKAGKRAVEPSAADAGERKFLLPDCIAMGFLIPDDAQIIADMKRKKELNDKLKKL